LLSKLEEELTETTGHEHDGQNHRVENVGHDNDGGQTMNN